MVYREKIFLKTASKKVEFRDLIFSCVNTSETERNGSKNCFKKCMRKGKKKGFVAPKHVKGSKQALPKGGNRLNTSAKNKAKPALDSCATKCKGDKRCMKKCQVKTKRPKKRFQKKAPKLGPKGKKGFGSPNPMIR